jgi:RNA 3'-terminal phosphate cyclase
LTSANGWKTLKQAEDIFQPQLPRSIPEYHRLQRLVCQRDEKRRHRHDVAVSVAQHRYPERGKAVVLFARPSVIAEGSGAEAVAKEIAVEVIEAIETVRPVDEPLSENEGGG